MRSRVVVTIALILCTSFAVFADVRTEQKTQVQFAGMFGRMVNLFGGRGVFRVQLDPLVAPDDRDRNAARF